MVRSLYTAATGMKAQQFYMDTISNNLSNVNSRGFKKETVHFKDLMYQTLSEPGTRNPEGSMAPSGIEVGLGVRVSGTSRQFTQGSPAQTGNDLDMAIVGDGMFQILLPDGSMAYTRDGQFQRSNDGTLVTSEGYYLYPEMAIPQGYDQVSVSAEGAVTATRDGSGNQESVEMGQLELARFINPGGLVSLGNNLFKESVSSGEPVTGTPVSEGYGKVLNKYLEESNVDMVDEMVGMISAQRAYEIVSKSITVSEEMMQTATGLKR